MNIDFKNKVILVTWSTSSIGRQIAKQLLENNAKVIINYGQNENMAKETMEELAEWKENIVNLYVKKQPTNFIVRKLLGFGANNVDIYNLVIST